MTTATLCPPAEDVDDLLAGRHPDPGRFLGAHRVEGGTVVRTLQPRASAVWLLTGERRRHMYEVATGLYARFVPERLDDHLFEVSGAGGAGRRIEDITRWPSTFGELDLHLIGEGRHERLWEVLGAHPRSWPTPHGDVSGTSFAVWAPNARGVRVAGDFDGWDGRATPLRALGTSGVWEVFVPGVLPGCRYKFRLLAADGSWHERADPVAFAAELPPATASVVAAHDFTWTDTAWLDRRARTEPATEPVSVYEVHLGSWRSGLSYRDLAEELGDYVQEMGFTHIELLPVTEHPFGGSWGYQATSYFAPTARFGSPDDFRYFVDHLHGRGIGVILDWVPGHFPRDRWALGRFDNTALYEHADPRRGEHPDWGTYVFNHGRNEVRNFLVASALYWLSEFHVDGLRVDAVASMLYLDYSRRDGEWVANVHGGHEDLQAVEFLRELNAVTYRRFPGIMMIAEESTAWPGVTRPAHEGGLGFGFKWNMGWMHDVLRYLGRPPETRTAHGDEIRFSFEYTWNENYLLPLSHDEVVHGKGSLLARLPGDRAEQAAGLRALLACQWAHPGKQLLFMGGEFGQPGEWDAAGSLHWHLLDDPTHRGIQRLVTDLNAHYRTIRALHTSDGDPAGFTWLSGQPDILAFLRRGDDGSELACVVNFSGRARDHRIGLPSPGPWREILNTDSPRYLGSGPARRSTLVAAPVPLDGLPASASLNLAAHSALWLSPVRDPTPLPAPL